MFLAHISFLISGMLLGFLFARKLKTFIACCICMSGIYAWISIMPLMGVFEFQMPEFLFRTCLMMVSSFAFGYLIRKKRVKLLPIPLICGLFAAFFEQTTDQIKHTTAFFTEITEVSQTDTTTIYNYRFRPERVVSLPRNLNQAHEMLDSLFAKSKIDIDKITPNELHFGFGAGIRNEWGLWNGKTKIAKELKGKGINLGDDMSAYIFETYFLRHKMKKAGKFKEAHFYSDVTDSMIEL